MVSHPRLPHRSSRRMTRSSTFSGSSPLASGPHLKLEFFGGPALSRDGGSVRLSPFQSGLLSIALASGHGRIPRSKVQRLLWNVDQGKAVRHRLSQLVYQTNHRCQTRVIALDGEYVRVNTGIVATDLQEFDDLLRSSDFLAACRLLERGFLSAFPGRKTDALADWIKQNELGRRTRLRNMAPAAWDTSAAANDWLNVQVSAEALFRLDPNDEVILRRVIRAQAMGGMVREAETLYRSFVEYADATGDWSPEPGTRGLLKMIKALGRGTGERPGVAKAGDSDAVLIGRASELGHLNRSIFRNALRDPWHTITVSGHAGIGKSRLVEEAIHGTHLRGYQVMRACPGGLERDIPLSPLLEALDQPWVAPLLESVAGPWRTHLLSLLPQFSKRTGAPAEVADGLAGHTEALRRHTCEGFLHLFTAIAQSRPTIVFLDDFHSADEASATVIQFLHRRWQRGNLTLILCYREQELMRSALVGQLIDELESDPGSTPIRLRELANPAARKLVSSLGAELDGPAIDHVVELAGGNPQFLIELAANAQDIGNRRPPDDHVHLPDTIRTIVRRHLAELDPEARNLLAGLAVFGRPATLGQLARITGHTRRECIDALEPLHTLRLINRTGDKVSIRPGVVRHFVYQDLSPTRRSMLHGLAAEALGPGSAESRPDLVALHYYRAGQRNLAYIYAVEATRPDAELPPRDRLRLLEVAHEVGEGPRRNRATLALARASHRARQLDSACRYGAEALRRGAGLGTSDLAGARLVVADSTCLLGRRPLAFTLTQLAELEKVARDEGDDAVVAAVLSTTLMVLHRSERHGDVTRLLAGIDEMAGFEDPLANCRILAVRTMVAEYGDPAAGLARAREAVRVARTSKLHGELMFALHRYIATLATAGLLATGEGRTALDRAESAARRSDDIASHVLILLQLADWHAATGDHEIAAGVLEQASTLAGPMDCPEIRALEHLARGNLALARGDPPGTLPPLPGAPVSGLVSPGDPGPDREGTSDPGDTRAGREAPVPANLLPAVAALEGRLSLESGKFGRAAEISDAHPVAEPLHGVPVELILFHARLQSRKGDTVGALDLLGRAAEAHEAVRPLHWLRLVLDLVRLSRRCGNPRPGLAGRARERAVELELPGLAHEFVPFAT